MPTPLSSSPCPERFHRNHLAHGRHQKRHSTVDTDTSTFDASAFYFKAPLAASTALMDSDSFDFSGPSAAVARAEVFELQTGFNPTLASGAFPPASDGDLIEGLIGRDTLTPFTEPIDLRDRVQARMEGPSRILATLLTD